MIEERGLVVSLEGEYAYVETERRSACGTCQATGACGTSLIERVFGRRSIQLRALNRADAAVGDRVLVGISEQGLLTASMAVYLVPILALVGGALIGQTLADHPAIAVRGDLMSLPGAASGFALALLWLRRYSARSAARPEQQAIVLRRVVSGLPVELHPTSGPRH